VRLESCMFLAWEVLLSAALFCFPKALLEIIFVMLATLLVFLALHRQTSSAAHVDSSKSLQPRVLDASSTSSTAALLVHVGLILVINLAATVIRLSPGLAEAATLVLLMDLLRSVFYRSQTGGNSQTMSAPAVVTKPVTKDVPSKPAPPQVPPSPPRKEKELPVMQDEAASDTQELQDPKSGSLWADLEEEDDFQQKLAAKMEAEVEPSEQVEMQAKAPAGEHAAEPPRRKGKGEGKEKGKKAGGRGKGGGDDLLGSAGGNQWAQKIRACGKAKDLPGALAAVEQALAEGSGLSSRQQMEVQNALLHALVHCDEDAGDTASELFNQLKAEKRADVVTFNIMLRSLLHAGKREEAQALLHEMADHGLSANKVTISELLSDRVKADDTEGVWRIIDWMRSTDFGITNAACSILLKRIVPELDSEEVDRTFELIDCLSEPVDEALCSQAVEACVRANRTDLASKYMDQLWALRGKNKNVSANAATYGSMIKLHGQNHDVKQIWSTWYTMREKGVNPSSITMGCMVEALVNSGATEDAAALVRDISDEEVVILNTVIYSSIIKGFAQLKKPEKCFTVMDEMEARGIPGNTITYNTLLDACAKCGMMMKVPEVFETMRQKQIEPDRITYSTLIKGFCVSGELDRACQLFEELKLDGKLELDEIVYNSLIDGCGRRHKPQKALELLEDMIKGGISPSNYTMSILVKLLGRSKRLQDAANLVDRFRNEFGLRPNLQVYTCLIQACLFNKKTTKAMDLYNLMVGDLGRLPDQKAHTVMIEGLLHCWALGEAVQVARCAYKLKTQDLQMPEKTRGEAGVEAKVLTDLASKVRGSRDTSLMQQLQEVVSVAEQRGDVRNINCMGPGVPGGDGEKGDRKGDKGSGKKGKSSGRGKASKKSSEENSWESWEGHEDNWHESGWQDYGYDDWSGAGDDGDYKTKGSGKRGRGRGKGNAKGSW